MPWNTGDGERNELVYFPRVWEANKARHPSLYVNGVKAPVAWRLAGMTGSQETDRYNGNRSYAAYGWRSPIESDAPLKLPRVRYENLCTEDAWRGRCLEEVLGTPGFGEPIEAAW